MDNKAVETMTLWAEANQRVMRELLDLSVGAAKEGMRLYAELQQGAIDAVRDGQASAIKWQASWQDAPKDPMAWYQLMVAEAVDGAQKLFRAMEGNAQAVTRSAERLQETVATTVGRIKDTYSQN